MAAGRLQQLRSFLPVVSAPLGAFICAKGTFKNQQRSACCAGMTNHHGGSDSEITRISFMSTMRGDAEIARKNVDKIVQQSVGNNTTAEVSGYMCYDAMSKRVYQFLESGSPEALSKTWERISKDARHVIDDDSILQEVVDTRKYPKGLGLGYQRFDQEDSKNHSTGEVLQVRYKSFLKDLGGNEAEVVDEMLKKAISQNAELGVTGWCLYDDRNLVVYQVLEGPPAVVERLFDKIRQDPRHDVSSQHVARRRSQSREFSSWAVEKILPPAWSNAAY